MDTRRYSPSRMKVKMNKKKSDDVGGFSISTMCVSTLNFLLFLLICLSVAIIYLGHYHQIDSYSSATQASPIEMSLRQAKAPRQQQQQLNDTLQTESTEPRQEQQIKPPLQQQQQLIQQQQRQSKPQQNQPYSELESQKPHQQQPVQKQQQEGESKNILKNPLLSHPGPIKQHQYQDFLGNDFSILGDTALDVSKMKPNLIIGLADNIDAPNLAIFCGSAHRFVQSATVLIFVRGPDIPPQLVDIAKMTGAILIEYRQESLNPKILRTYHSSSLRWIFYYGLFGERNSLLHGKFERVAMVDVRDTVFQSDPFWFLRFERHESLLVFGEELRMTIGECGWNSGWIKSCFGNVVLNRLTNDAIICSGVSLGTMNATAKYVSMMGTMLLGNMNATMRRETSLQLPTSYFPQCERNGVDQGLHNVLVHLGYIQAAKINFEADFPLVHLQSTVTATFGPPRWFGDANQMQQLQIKERAENVVAGVSGVTSSIVHQYDRHVGLQTQIFEKYVYWRNSSFSDENIWAEEEGCSSYTLVSGNDLFAGMCDKTAARVASIDSCCRRCNDLTKNAKKQNGTGLGCFGFAFSEGVCYFKSCVTEFQNNAKIRSLMDSYASFQRLKEMVDSNSNNTSADTTVQAWDENLRVALAPVDKNNKFLARLPFDARTNRFRGFVRSAQYTLDVHSYITFLNIDNRKLKSAFDKTRI